MNLIRHCASSLLAGLVVCAGMTASAAAAPLASLLACRGIADPTARLACYDRESAALDKSAAPGKAARLSSKPPQPLDPKKTFGLPEGVVAEKEVAAGTRAHAVSGIEAHLVGLSRMADGRVVFTLDNGQVWRQLLPEGEMLAKVGDEATISRGWLGSYWLKLKSGRNCKVDRVR